MTILKTTELYRDELIICELYLFLKKKSIGGTVANMINIKDTGVLNHSCLRK